MGNTKKQNQEQRHRQPTGAPSDPTRRDRDSNQDQERPVGAPDRFAEAKRDTDGAAREDGDGERGVAEIGDVESDKPDDKRTDRFQRDQF